MRYLGVYSVQSGYSFVQNPFVASLEKGMWACLNIGQHVTIYYTNDVPIEISASRDRVVIGSLFQKSDYSAVSINSFDTLESLLNNAWGEYLLFDANGIFRDPSNRYSVFYTQLEGNIFFSNQIFDLFKITNHHKTINWHYISNYILFLSRQSNFTAFEKIFELPSGCFLQANIKKLTEPKVIWDPTCYAKSVNLNHIDLKEKKLEIPKILKDVLIAKTYGKQKLVLKLSGGLDSSSIAFTLSNPEFSDKNIQAVTIYDPGTSVADERKYARSVCNKLGFQLIEFDANEALPFDFLPDAEFPPNYPDGFLSIRAQQNKLHSFFERDSVFINGHGGDQLFGSPPPMTLITDAFLHKKSELFSLALELCSFYKVPITTIFCKNLIAYLKYLAKIKNKQKINEHNQVSWLYRDKALFSPTLTLLHPFFKNFPKVFPGKAAHIEAIYQAQYNVSNSQQFNALEPNTIFPLMSQPMMECALSFPVYEFFSNKYDRYLYRKVFSEHYPKGDFFRKNKGETSSILKIGLEKNFNDIKNLVLDGVLVKEKMVDPNFLYVHLKSFSNGFNKQLWPLMNLIACEKFFKLWGYTG